MAGNTTTYSFDDVDVVFTHPALGQYPVTGKGVGTISVTMQTEKTQHDVAADGSVMISKIPGDNASVDIEIQQTSAFHKWLTNYYNFILLSPSALWAQAYITIRDKVGGSLITAFDVSPLKKADRGYQAQGQRVTWPFLSANCHETNI